MPRALVVVNPISGRPDRGASVDRLDKVLTAAGWDVRVSPTAGPGDGENLARIAAGQGTEAVVAAGGDGTVNEVARGLLSVPGTPSRLAILARGTSNLLARELELAGDPDVTARSILDGRPRAIDVGEANGRLFLACVGVGWDADVVERLSRCRTGHIGFATYLGPGLSAAVHYPFPLLRVLAPGAPPVEGHLVTVLNARPYAAFFTPIPHARADDGELDVLVLRRSGRLDLPRWIWKGLRGTLHEDRCATVLRGRRFRIESTTPAPCQIDGDVCGATPVTIRLRPAALRVFAPRQTV